MFFFLEETRTNTVVDWLLNLQVISSEPSVNILLTSCNHCVVGLERSVALAGRSVGGSEYDTSSPGPWRGAYRLLCRLMLLLLNFHFEAKFLRGHGEV